MKTTEPPPSKREALSDRLQSMAKVADKFKRWKPATQVLTKVRAHPTIFPLVDRATGVGGWPIERVSLVHGPTGFGKTALVHGLGLSFLQAANFYCYVDAEYTTPEDWLRVLMRQYADHPGFRADRPRTYEETVDSVREAVEGIANAREKGDLPPDVTALIVVDSIRKLVPERLLKQLLKDGATGDKGSVDGMRGRGAMYKAALNAQWLDELVPLLYHCHAGLVFVSREYEQQLDLTKLSQTDAMSGVDFKVGGGKALMFESSLAARVTRSWVKAGEEVVGERHHVLITKTKIAGKSGKTASGYFHTSNGVLVPAGFDRARDVLELAQDAGAVEQRGGWLIWKTGGKKWQGVGNAVKALTGDEAMLDKLEEQARGSG